MGVKTVVAIIVGFVLGVISATGIRDALTRIGNKAEHDRLAPIEEELENAGIPT